MKGLIFISLYPLIDVLFVDVRVFFRVHGNTLIVYVSCKSLGFLNRLYVPSISWTHNKQ